MNHRPNILRSIFQRLVPGMILLTATAGLASAGTASPPKEAAQPPVAEIDIRIADYPADPGPLILLARDLLLLRVGAPFSPPRMQQSIEMLRNSECFRQIEADTVESAAGLVLRLDLTPFARISSIDVDGHFPLFEKEVLKEIRLRAGGVLRPDRIAQHQERLEALFRGQGFVNPRVRIETEADSRPGLVQVNIVVDKGPYETLKDLKIEGNQAFTDARIKRLMKTWWASLLPSVSGRFQQVQLKKDVRQISAYYRRKKYADVQVHRQVDRDRPDHAVGVRVEISEGPRYETRFEGNQAFNWLALQPDLALFDRGNRAGRGVRKTLRNLRDRYRRAGYAQARIEARIEDVSAAGGPVRRVTFVIEEGPRSEIHAMVVRGNRTLSEGEIRRQISARESTLLGGGGFDPHALSADRKAVEEFYRRQGFMQAHVNATSRRLEPETRVEVQIDIQEGPRTQVAAVEFDGLRCLTHTQALGLLSMKPGSAFHQTRVSADAEALAAAISEKGYPHVRVEGTVEAAGEAETVAVTYRVQEGPTVILHAVRFNGNLRTRPSVLWDEMVQRPGDLFSRKRMLADQRRLRDLGLFQQVRFRPVGLKEKAERVVLFADLEEKKPYYLEAGFGYETSRGFYVNGKLGDRNALGRNLLADTSAEVSEIGYRWDAHLGTEDLLRTKVKAAVGLFAERKAEFNQQFGTQSVGGTLSFTRDWTAKFGAELGLQLEQREQFATDGTADATDQEGRRQFLVLSPALRLDTRDNIIRPRRGLYARGFVDMSKAVKGSLDDFFKYRLDCRGYWSPWKRLTLAGMFRVGYIDVYGKTTAVASDQLMFLGGTGSVRGYKENLLEFDADGDPVGGRLAQVGSAEARFDAGYNIEVSTFCDLGRISETQGTTEAGDLRAAVGLGLRYMTPIGPVGLLYGHKLDPREGESNGRVHFSFGYTF